MTEPLRAGDADRERTAARLRDAMAEGRLTPEEFQERLDAVYASRTFAELAQLTADLPGGDVFARPVPLRDAAVPGRRPPAPAGEWRRDLAGWSTAFVICNLIWLLAGRGYWWPGWLLIGLVVLAGRVAGGRGDERRRRIDERRRRRRELH